VPRDAPPVVGSEIGERALVIADGERRLVTRASGVGGLEVKVGGAVVALSASQMPGHDGCRDASRERGLRQVLTQGAVHSNPILGIELHVGHIASQRVTEVGQLALSVA
jgi:hypothetical protein